MFFIGMVVWLKQKSGLLRLSDLFKIKYDHVFFFA